MRKKDNIKLSVIIISYKQAKYIRDAIDSVLMQNFDFKYELLLADDCSQDGTLEIMKEYEKKNPSIIRVIERKKNLGCKNNSLSACSEAKGEYLTILEGDDYWSDKNKIRIQIDFLEAHPDYYAYSHSQEGRNLKNEYVGTFPKKNKKSFTINNEKEYIRNDYTFSCSSTVFRNLFKDKKKYNEYKSIREFDEVIGDSQLCFMLCKCGKVYVSNEPMMVYRIRSNDGDSNFNSSHTIDEIEYRFLNIYSCMKKYYNNEYSFYKQIKYHYTLGVAYDICKFNLKDIKRFNRMCPRNYKWKIIVSFPFTCVKILINRFFI